MSDGPVGAQATAVNAEDMRVLVVAPPGCGKTEVLAMRAQHLLATGRVRPHRKILALTFTNRARDNIRQRLQRQLGEDRSRRSVDIVNFHEFAIRLVQAHGNLVGLGDAVEYPNRSWMKKALARQTQNWRAQRAATEIMDAAKRAGVTNAELLTRIEESGDAIAVAVEKERQQAGYLDYGDLLRYAQLTLWDPRVRAVFREHYDAVLVDEFQDLSLQQFEIAATIAAKSAMFVGDPYQGIFGWAGAEPVQVHQLLLELGYRQIDLDISFRSSPAVLAVVNALSAALGATPLSAANPGEWPSGGTAHAMSFATDTDEARGVVALCDYLAGKYSNDRIGVICRSEYRRGALEQAFTSATHTPQFWDIALDTPQVAAILKRQARRLRTDVPYPDQVENLLQRTTSALRRSDIETMNDLESACEQLLEMEALGLDLPQVLSRIRDVRGNSADEPGVHILNAHTGKGQQFDWVIVVGLEEGHVPSTYAETDAELLEEQRVLMVMVSRAKRGVFASHAQQTSNRYGRVFRQGPSRWWPAIASTSQPIPASFKALVGCG